MGENDERVFDFLTGFGFVLLLSGLNDLKAEISMSQLYIGCYKDDNNNRSMGDVHYLGSLLTLEACVDRCANLNFTYAGVQFSYECFCADSYDKHGPCEMRTPPCSCNNTCKGNRRQICGGASAISVYRVCLAGCYGKGCRQMCNCASGECYYRNGSCRNSACKSGWTGQRCDIRDCGKNNGDCSSDEKCEVVDLNYANVSVCRCREGFRKVKLSDNCTDRDECSEASLIDVCGPYAINCTNTFGSYRCICGNSTHDRNGRCTQVTPKEGGTTDYSKVIIGVLASCFALIGIGVTTAIYQYRRRQSSRGVQDNKDVSANSNGDHSTTVLSDTKSAEMTYMALDKRPHNDRLYEDLHLQSQSANRKVEMTIAVPDDSKIAELTYMGLDRRSDKNQVYDDLRVVDYENMN